MIFIIDPFYKWISIEWKDNEGFLWWNMVKSNICKAQKDYCPTGTATVWALSTEQWAVSCEQSMAYLFIKKDP